jgi:hypothetical protein
MIFLLLSKDKDFCLGGKDESINLIPFSAQDAKVF